MYKYGYIDPNIAYICTHMNIYTNVYTYIYIHMSIYTYICAGAHSLDDEHCPEHRLHMYTYKYIHIHIYVYESIHIHICRSQFS